MKEIYFYNVFMLITFFMLLNIFIVSKSAEAVEAQQIKSVTLFAMGDIMMHKSQLDAGYNKKTGRYDFSNYFKYINQYFKDGDIVYANLETPIAGLSLRHTGYPAFNAPNELLTELKNNSFTHLSLANNHTLDRGATGVKKTIENVSDAGFVGIGTRMNVQKPNYEITEVNGMKLGFLAYTYGTNGLKLSSSNAYMLSYINKDQIAKDIKDLKSQNVDAVIVGLHFGDEYKLQQNKFQEEIAQFVCDNGADIILGSHPHVLEPIVFLNDHKCLVAYSLGNFISGMSAIYTDVAGILKIEIRKDNNLLSITPDFIGTWVKRGFNLNGSRYYNVMPLDIEKIPNNIKITLAEHSKTAFYRKFINTKIKAY